MKEKRRKNTVFCSRDTDTQTHKTKRVKGRVCWKYSKVDDGWGEWESEESGLRTVTGLYSTHIHTHRPGWRRVLSLRLGHSLRVYSFQPEWERSRMARRRRWGEKEADSAAVEQLPMPIHADSERKCKGGRQQTDRELHLGFPRRDKCSAEERRNFDSERVQIGRENESERVSLSEPVRRLRETPHENARRLMLDERERTLLRQ